jgi:hypothetical protein
MLFEGLRKMRKIARARHELGESSKTMGAATEELKRKREALIQAARKGDGQSINQAVIEQELEEDRRKSQPAMDRGKHQLAELDRNIEEFLDKNK